MKNQKTENQEPQPQQKEDYGESLSLSFLDVREVAHYLKLRPSTIYSMAGNRKIPFYRIGRQLRFRKFEIDEWAQGLKQPAVDAKVEARKVISSLQRRPNLDVDRIVKKAIDEAGKKGYTSQHGKPDQSRGLREEVEHGYLP